MKSQFNNLYKISAKGSNKICGAEWTFSKLKSRGFFSGYCCSMKWNGIQARGYGYDISPKPAIVKAFCEAWERCCFKNSDYATTNGFAAGSTELQARVFALKELVEREVLLKSWREKKGWSRHRLNSKRALFLKTFLELNKWDVRTYKVRSSTGYLIASLAISEKYGVLFDCSFSFNMESSKNSELKSLIGICFEIENRTRSYSEKLEPSPNGHKDFYSNPKNLKAFSFLESNCNEVINLEELDEVKYELINPSEKMPVVVRCYHERWNQLEWGIKSIRGENKWPHPLA